MKLKRSRATQAARFNPAELLFWVLPLLALIPNFFQIPDLSYTGLATQEVAFAVAMLALSFAGLVEVLQQPTPTSMTRAERWMFWLLGMCLLWQFASLSWSPDWSEGVRALGLWFGLGLLFFAQRWLFTESSRWPLFITLALATGLLLWSVVYEYLHYGPEQMLGIFFNHGISAELLALLLPFFLLVFLIEEEQSWAVIVALLAAAGSVAALLLTLRRGPLLATFITGLAIGLLLLTRTVRVATPRRLYVIGAALLLIALPLAIYKREAILARWRGATQLQTAANTRAVELGLTSRAVTWLTAWEMGKQHWLKGVGIGGYEASYGTYKQLFVNNPRYAKVAAAAEREDYDEIRSPRAHSEYLQIFAELGLTGVILFTAFWWLVIHQLWRRRSAECGYQALAALLAVLAFGICSLISAFSFRSPPVVLLLGCLLTLGLSVPAPPPAEAAPDTRRTVPRFLLLGGTLLSVCAALALTVRNYNVYASQQAQSGLDFRFNLTDAASNEVLARRYQQVLALDSANAGAHLGYGLLLFQMKRLPESQQHIEYAFRHGYGRPFTILLRAFCQEQLGNLAQATETLATGLQSFPKSIVLRAAYAELLRKQGELEAAAAQRAQLEQIDHRIARGWDLALRLKDEPATEIARREGVLSPVELEPLLVRVLVQARAYHYLKKPDLN